MIDYNLIVDVQEPAYMKAKLQDIAITAYLQSGDYIWIDKFGRNWGIERKEITDMLNSFMAGRLTIQLRNLVDNFQFPVLLIEGTATMSEAGKVLVKSPNGSMRHRDFRWETMEDIKFEAELAGVFLTFSTSMNGSASRIRRLIEWSNKDEHGLLMDRRKKGLEFGIPEDSAEHVMTSLPGIGRETARILLSEFGTPFRAMRMFQGNAEVLKDVKGLGATKIKRVQKVLFGD